MHRYYLTSAQRAKLAQDVERTAKRIQRRANAANKLLKKLLKQHGHRSMRTVSYFSQELVDAAEDAEMYAADAKQLFAIVAYIRARKDAKAYSKFTLMDTAAREHVPERVFNRVMKLDLPPWGAV